MPLKKLRAEDVVSLVAGGAPQDRLELTLLGWLRERSPECIDPKVIAQVAQNVTPCDALDCQLEKLCAPVLAIMPISSRLVEWRIICGCAREGSLIKMVAETQITALESSELSGVAA